MDVEYAPGIEAIQLSSVIAAQLWIRIVKLVVDQEPLVGVSDYLSNLMKNVHIIIFLIKKLYLLSICTEIKVRLLHFYCNKKCK